MRVSGRWVWRAAALVLAAGVLYAADPRDAPAPFHTEPGVSDGRQAGLMLAKLASSQKIVDGLVLKDFNQIRRGAGELQRICEATEWAARSDPAYSHHRTELRRQAQKLSKMADQGNLDGAAFVYMHSLTTCIGCHEHCRDVLRIADERSPEHRLVPIPVDDHPIPGDGNGEASLPSSQPIRR